MLLTRKEVYKSQKDSYARHKNRNWMEFLAKLKQCIALSGEMATINLSMKERCVSPMYNQTSKLQAEGIFTLQPQCEPTGQHAMVHPAGREFQA
jgi:hypothetical protein